MQAEGYGNTEAFSWDKLEKKPYSSLFTKFHTKRWIHVVKCVLLFNSNPISPFKLMWLTRLVLQRLFNLYLIRCQQNIIK